MARSAPARPFQSSPTSIRSRPLRSAISLTSSGSTSRSSAGNPLTLAIPAADPNVNVLVPYNSYWAARYAPDSTDAALHLLIDPTPRVRVGFYPSEVAEDPQSHLPSHIEMRVAGGNDEIIQLDYAVMNGHWIIQHGRFSATQHAAFLTFKVIADVTFSQIAFPSEPPDPRLAGTPIPAASPP